MPSIPLLSTKFYIPTTSSSLVARPRLMARFQAALERPLTLVSAPPGSGKTTLAAAWLQTLSSFSPRPAACWLSLDPADNSPARFWSYVTAALRKGLEDGGEAPESWGDILDLIQAGPSAGWEPILDALINAVDAAARPAVLVLDDAHVIQSLPIHEGLAYLVEHLPPNLHLVIASRSDPPLPIHRLRARGRLNELRAADLRFSPDEAAELLERVSQLSLSAEAAAALERSTEGWAAGLQMAALALQASVSAASTGQPEAVRSFIAAFSGQNAFIIDYLAEEVFNRQPAELQGFLLQTSLLDEMCAELCDFLLEAPGASREMLQRLEAANLFLIPLDSQRRWYRYHHLFADLLRARLRERHAERIHTLHLRASLWCEHEGAIPEAVRHALAARDWQRSAALVERFWRLPVESGESETALGWLDALPPAVVRANPALSFAYCWIYWLSGQIHRIQHHLEDVLRSLPPLPSGAEVDPHLAELWSQVALVRSILQRHKGDLPGAVAFARESVERTTALPTGLDAEQRALLQGVAYYHLAESLRFSGSLAEAAAAFEQAIPRLSSRSPVAASAAYYLLAHIQQTLGRLRLAAETCRQGLEFASSQANPRQPPYAVIHLAAGEVLCEQNELEEAARELSLAQEIGRGNLTVLRCGAYLDVRLLRARGALRETLPLLEEALRAVQKVEADYLVAEVKAVQARVWIELGEMGKAAQWVAGAGFGDPPGPLPGGVGPLDARSEIELSSYARFLIAQGRGAEALRLLEGCLSAAEAAERHGNAIEFLVLRALAHQQLGERKAAQADAKRAVLLAEPEGFRRVFLDEGQPMRLLMADFRSSIEKQNPQSEMVEPLTERELEVLRLLAQGLSNHEMAEKLFVSEGTVKTHVHNLIGKLGAQSRTHAIALARELDLL